MKLIARFFVLFFIFSLPVYVMEVNDSKKIKISSPIKNITVTANDKENEFVIKNKDKDGNLSAFFVKTNSIKLKEGNNKIKFNLLDFEEQNIACIIKFKHQNTLVTSNKFIISPEQSTADLNLIMTENLETNLFIHFYAIKNTFKSWRLTDLSWSR